MEKRIRKAEYFKNLVNEMGTTPLTAEELKEIIVKEEQKAFGDSETGSSAIIDAVFKKLIDMIDRHLDVVKMTDVKIERGKNYPKVYCISGKTTLGAVRDVESHFASKAEKRSEAMKSLKPNPGHDKKAIERVENILRVANLRADKIALFSDLAKAAGKEHVSRAEVESWLNTVARHGINIQYSFELLDYGRKGSTGLRILPSPGSYFDSVRKLAEKAGVPKIVEVTTTKIVKTSDAVIPEKSYVPTLPVVAEKKEEPANEPKPVIEQVEETAITNFDKVIFIVGSILNAEKRPISMADLAATLRNKFGIENATNTFIFNKIKDVHEISRHGEILSLTSGTWATFVKKYSPASFVKDTIYARIGMSLEEVKQYFPTAEIFSAICERDNIYSFTISYSHHDWNKLIKLYRTFRGTDAIIDKKLGDILHTQVLKIDGNINKDDKYYQLERAIY